MFKQVRNYLLTGLLTLTPIVVTAYVLWQLFFMIDNLLGPKVARIYGYTVPGMGLVALLVLLLLTGILARNFIGRKLIHLGEMVLVKIPLFNRIYIAVQQISHAFLAKERGAFKRAVLIEYPRKGIYAIGFLTSRSSGEIQKKTEQDLYHVFLPTTPNPTSGYLLLIPHQEVIPLDMTVEEALKLVISGGVVVPGEQFKAHEVQKLEMPG